MESLKDPCNDRPCKSLPPPPAQPMTEDVLYKKGVPDIAVLQDHFSREGTLAEDVLLNLIKTVSALFSSEPNLLKLKDPITVVGDIHGQYYDFVKMLEVGGPPGDVQYIFLGDYVDRGSYSVEVLALLWCLKIKFPKRVWMLRGNHECRQMTAFFNFRDECEYKYNTNMYDAIMDCMDTLPLAATINGKFLGVHGGLSPEMVKLKDLASVDRFHEPPREGIHCDLIWADPVEEKEGQPPPKKSSTLWIPNEVRGCSYFFTFDCAVQFLQKNGLLSVIRAHEAQVEGYKMHRTNPATGFPSVITIFSAPNYCDCYNNKAAILKFDNNTLNILQFNCSPHPYHLPNFMDTFTWSMPFVIEKVTEMLYFILQPASDEEYDDVDFGDLPPGIEKIFRNSMSKDQNEAVELAAKLAQHIEQGGGEGGGGHRMSVTRKDHLRKKVKTVARMARMFKTLRQENETVIRLKGVCPGHKLAPGLLLAGKDAMEGELGTFGHLKNLDADNEKRPDLQTPSISIK